MDLHLTPAETARRFGVTIKALRLYEQRGLLAPVRTINGATGSAWRLYGPDQIARLHQILALKRLGLSLAKIGQLLAGPDALEPVLALQEEALAKDAARLARALKLVQAARAKLKSGTALSIDDLANLTKETVMTTQDRKALFDAAFARHFNADEREAIRAKRATLLQDWQALEPQLRAAMAAGDPASPQARDVVARCREMNQKITGADETLRARFRAFRDDIAQDPDMVGMMAVTPEMIDFVKRATAASK
jgi:DNA-binding transcriptional MerR regulator